MTVTTARSRNKGPRVFVCLACDLLAESSRADALTCSSRCRVWLHRNPERLDSLKAACAPMRLRPSTVQEAHAIRRLRPDLATRIGAGELENNDVRADMHVEFTKLVMREALRRVESDSTP